MDEQVLLERMRKTAQELQVRYGYSSADFVNALAGVDVVPLSVFATSMSPLRAVVTYLHRNQGVPLKKVAVILHRGYQAVWNACQDSSLVVGSDGVVVPLSIFDSKMSISECLILYLHDGAGFGFTAIGHLLHRDPRTVWTMYQRAKKKDAI